MKILTLTDEQAETLEILLDYAFADQRDYMMSQYSVRDLVNDWPHVATATAMRWRHAAELAHMLRPAQDSDPYLVAARALEDRVATAEVLS